MNPIFIGQALRSMYTLFSRNGIVSLRQKSGLLRIMKSGLTIVFSCAIIVFFFLAETCCLAQSEMAWRAGGQIGLIGDTFSKFQGEYHRIPTMSLSLSYDMAIGDTPWRGGIDVGTTYQGLWEYRFEENEADRFVRTDFMYAGAFADYGFHLWKLPLFCRAGLAYARQNDMWVKHNEYKSIPLVITGFGFDWNHCIVMLNGYIAPEGILVLTLSGGAYFGKRKPISPHTINDHL